MDDYNTPRSLARSVKTVAAVVLFLRLNVGISDIHLRFIYTDYFVYILYVRQCVFFYFTI